MPVKKKKKPEAQGVETMLIDTDVPLQMRVGLLRSVCQNEDEGAEQVLAKVLGAAADQGEARLAKKTAELEELLSSFREGPLRTAFFLRLVDLEGCGRRAEVVLEDGTRAYCMLADEGLADRLRTGDTVWLEATGKALLFAESRELEVGEEALLERRVGADRVEVSTRGEERHVLMASSGLLEELETGKLEPGDRLIASTQLRLAFGGLPREDELSHFRFLDRSPAPDVLIERDIGDPPEYIEELRAHVWTAMERPDLMDRWGVRHSAMALLEGPPGTGKTLSVDGLIRAVYQDVAAITGLDLEQVPPLVLRVRPGQVLSEWLGRSDKNLDRLFDEAEALTAEALVGPDGRSWPRPAVIVFEEVDSLARTRGSDHEGVYDRIQTTLLQRLDPARASLAGRLLIVVGTTNVGNLVDRAFVRRIGGLVENFGHLDRRGCSAVLEKLIGERPVAPLPGEAPAAARSRLAGELTAWLYSSGGEDPGQVELVFTGSSERVVRYRRDFLTGGLLDRALQSASREALRDSLQGFDTGLAAPLIERAIDRQVRGIVERLDERSVAQYLPLPDGARVHSLRRIPQPTLLLAELERSA